MIISRLFNKQLKRLIPLLSLLLLISFNSICQTTSSLPPYTIPGKIIIDTSQARKIARDLAAYKSLLLQDSTLMASIEYYKYKARLDSSTQSLYQQQISFQSNMILDYQKKDTAQIDITKRYQKQVKILKIERTGLIVLATVFLLKLAFK